MELNEFILRVAEGLTHVDAADAGGRSSQRTGQAYLPGVKTMTEVQFVSAFANWWVEAHPNDLKSSYGDPFALEVKYPSISRAKCDLVFCTDGSTLQAPEWAVEFKHISLAGDNGKNNDFNVPKMLSPYLKDRSLMHDLGRLREDPIAAKQAVIGYCFDYSFDTCDEALRRHPDKADVIKNLRSVCRSVDPKGGVYSVLPLVEFANEIYKNEGLVGDLHKAAFSNAWRHPAGGNGWVFGWEVLP